MPYLQLTVYYFEATIKPFNKHPRVNLTYLSRNLALSVAINDALSKQSVYLADENLQCLIVKFVISLTEYQEAIVADVWK